MVLTLGDGGESCRFFSIIVKKKARVGSRNALSPQLTFRTATGACCIPGGERDVYQNRVGKESKKGLHCPAFFLSTSRHD